MSKQAATTIPGLCVVVKMGGKIRRMMFDLNAWAFIEEKTGLAINDEELWKNISFGRVLILLKAAFLHENPNISMKELGRMFDASGLPTITDAIKLAMQRQTDTTEEQPASPLATETASVTA